MNKEIQNTLSDCVKTKTSDILQEERAQHSERLEKVQDLLNKNMDLWEKKDALQSEERDFRSEITKLKKDVNKITKESLIHEKVRERLLTISAEKWYNCDLGGIRIWTGDLLICSQMLYHWAIPPRFSCCITVSVETGHRVWKRIARAKKLDLRDIVVLRKVFFNLHSVSWAHMCYFTGYMWV